MQEADQMVVVRPRSVLALVALGLVGAALAVFVDSAASAGKRLGTVQLRKTALGKVLVDSRGRSLYLFEADRHGRSSCYGKCASFWPALLVKAKPTAGTGVKASLLGTSRRKNGTRQVTYRGHPLYRFALDKRAGQVKGEDLSNFGAHWYVLNAAGVKVEPGDDSGGAGGGTTTTPPPTTTTGGGGYGYGGGGGG
jgi:predicted lipoprotein with Yx(FWY)xxD motif